MGVSGAVFFGQFSPIYFTVDPIQIVGYYTPIPAVFNMNGSDLWVSVNAGDDQTTSDALLTTRSQLERKLRHREEEPNWTELAWQSIVTDAIFHRRR